MAFFMLHASLPISQLSV